MQPLCVVALTAFELPAILHRVVDVNQALMPLTPDSTDEDCWTVLVSSLNQKVKVELQ